MEHKGVINLYEYIKGMCNEQKKNVKIFEHDLKELKKQCHSESVQIVVAMAEKQLVKEKEKLRKMTDIKINMERYADEIKKKNEYD